MATASHAAGATAAFNGPPISPCHTVPQHCDMPSNLSEVLSRLPVLTHRGASEEWDEYLRGVYGDVPPADAYPIDLRASRVLQLGSKLPLPVRPLRLMPGCASSHGHAWFGPLGCMMPESLAGTDGLAFVQHEKDGGRHGARATPFQSYEWVEVTRVHLDHPLERCSPWYFATRGSGVWWNTGLTYVASEAEAQEHWFPTWWHREELPASKVTTYTLTAGRVRAGAPPRESRLYQSPVCALSNHLMALLAQGYESIQLPVAAFRNHRFEMVDLRHVNSSWSAAQLACAASPHSDHACTAKLTCVGDLRAGWNASQPCVCGLARGGTIRCK